MELFDGLINIVSQGTVRRGHCAPYLPIEHGDIEEFLNIGKEGHPIQESTYAVTVGDKWLQEMIDGDEEKRKIWAKIIQRRTEIGYPYILFSDTVNNNTVDVYKDKKMRIHGVTCVLRFVYQPMMSLRSCVVFLQLTCVIIMNGKIPMLLKHLPCSSIR
jgi:ribonucleotide reductase alpha subunit